MSPGVLSGNVVTTPQLSQEVSPSPQTENVVAGTTTNFKNAAAATAQWRKVADQLRPKLPKLAAAMDEAEVDVLAYMDFPTAHRTKLHSTNSSTAWSAPSCLSRTMNGRFSALAT
jgi:hypothetical protein